MRESPEFVCSCRDVYSTSRDIRGEEIANQGGGGKIDDEDEEKETPEGKWNEGEEKDSRRLKAGEMERTGVMWERMCEIKKKQSKGSDGQIWRDNIKTAERERGVREEMRGASEVVDGGEQ